LESQSHKKSLKHLSERPWSDYTVSDYSTQQWHNACLIHQHTGPVTAKEQCKLPVKTPNGVVSRNAVHAAAAALAGARGGVHASSEEKASAAKVLIRYYHRMGEDPPPSLLKHSTIEDFIEHYGTKGMRWGVRRAATKAVKGPGKKTTYEKPAKKLSNEELQKRIKRLELEKKYDELNKKEATTVSNGGKFASTILSKSGANVATTLVTGAGLLLVGQLLKKKMSSETVTALTKQKLSKD
jgi:hypothetical protein